MKKSLLLIFLATIVVAGCTGGNNRTGFYYSDANNIGDESTWTIQPGFSSLDECRNWAEDVAGNNTNRDYECGYKCAYRSEYGMSVCKETVQ